MGKSLVDSFQTGLLHIFSREKAIKLGPGQEFTSYINPREERIRASSIKQV